MSRELVKGKVFYCGDYVNTDVMSPGRYDPIEDEEELAAIALIDYESKTPFVNRETNRSDFRVIVAGRDFGCGSSRETAPLALKYAGVNIILAKSFARIFFRNCINMGGMYPIILNHDFDERVLGEEIVVDLGLRKVELLGNTLSYEDFGPLEAIIENGGLSNYIKKNGGDL